MAINMIGKLVREYNKTFLEVQIPNLHCIDRDMLRELGVGFNALNENIMYIPRHNYAAVDENGDILILNDAYKVIARINDKVEIVSNIKANVYKTGTNSVGYVLSINDKTIASEEVNVKKKVSKLDIVKINLEIIKVFRGLSIDTTSEMDLHPVFNKILVCSIMDTIYKITSN